MSGPAKALRPNCMQLVEIDLWQEFSLIIELGIESYCAFRIEADRDGDSLVNVI